MSIRTENATDWPKEKFEPWVSEEQGKAIRDFVWAGGGLYALHNSSHISLFSRNYREVMGGAYIDHPPLRPFKVSVVNRRHPVTRGIRDFMVNDEQHFVTYDRDPKYILLESENLDGLSDITDGGNGTPGRNLGTRAVAGWAYDFGKGRVVFTAVGHTLHALWQPEYFQLQKNATEWLLKRSQGNSGVTRVQWRERAEWSPLCQQRFKRNLISSLQRKPGFESLIDADADSDSISGSTDFSVVGEFELNRSPPEPKHLPIAR